MAPNRVIGDRCLAPGVQDDGCPAGTLGLEDGTCEPAGIPPQLCAAGFEADGQRGCEPILPAEPCPLGSIAVPGDSQCRPVAPCGTGAWGDIPIEPNTIYVDARYQGVDSDGRAAAPFTTIGEALAAAPDGALIAVAAGSYVEDVSINHRVRLWGVCPDRVTIAGTGAQVAALGVYFGSGTEIHSIGVRGMLAGIDVTGSENVVLDRVWVHDVGWRGINTDTNFGPTSLTVSGSLIEGGREMGISVMGAMTATVEQSVVRDTAPRLGGATAGISIQLRCTERACEPEQRPSVTVRGSLLERNENLGLIVGGSEARIEGSVIRTTRSNAGHENGVGIATTLACHPSGVCYPEAPIRVAVVSSIVEQNQEYGLFAYGGETTIEGSVFRETLPLANGEFGFGINIEACEPEFPCPTRPRVSLRSSLIDRNQHIGMSAAGADATIDGTLFRDTLPRAFDNVSGNGLILTCYETGSGCPPAARTVATVRGSLLERNHDVSLSVAGSEALLEGVVVRDTLP
ncbi:MAG TPA: hypothetical protein VFB62_02870, partial [Polyangiaceae bacterium]|nr:hypothetical protein [Polyangiaceae bacterium]